MQPASDIQAFVHMMQELCPPAGAQPPYPDEVGPGFLPAFLQALRPG